jgi:hypothetical protein
MTLVRIGGQLVDDERSCVVPECSSAAAAEPYQTTLPAKLADLRSQAKAYARLAAAKALEADALEADIDAAEAHAYICGGHRSRLPRDVIGNWSPVPSVIAELPAAGRLDVEPGTPAEADAIAQAMAALDANPPPYREPRPTQPHHAHYRQRRADELAGT